jgi:serine protease AprX
MWRMWRRELTLALALAFLLSAFQIHADARSYNASKIDPVLLAQVLADPKAEYDVIVRSALSSKGDRTKPETSRDDRAKRAGDEIAKTGGKARHALGIVGGASGRIKGQLLLALTNNKHIDYVFADAPLTVTWDPLADADKATSPGIVSINAPTAWKTYGATGQGIGVAVVDSGIFAHPDIAGRVVAQVDFTASTVTTTDPVTGLTTTTTTGAVGFGTDPGGHGTHVAGLIAGDGTSSGGAFTGVAPKASLVDVRVIRSDGTSNTGIVLKGLQWVLANKNTYNIKVVNMSLGASATKSYKLDPLATATQVLTFAGITVVVSAGNTGPASATITSPANDPFVISVGAVDDNTTATTSDDSIATYSSRGRTAVDGLAKPDLSAPGRKMVSLRSPGSALDVLYPDRRVAGTDLLDPAYFRLSGTSMSAPVVAGAVALMLERNSTLKPAQIKKRLKSNASPLSGFGSLDQGAGRIDVAKTLASINTEKEYSEGRVSDSFAKDMRQFIQGQPLVWRDPAFNGGVDSRNITWDNITWDNITWDTLTWENLSWESLTWENLSWETITWENISWESADALTYDAMAGLGGWRLLPDDETTALPTAAPTLAPAATPAPTPAPAAEPTPAPTAEPTPAPTAEPTPAPTPTPTGAL